MKKIYLFLLVSTLLFNYTFALENLWYYTETERSRVSFKENYKKIDVFAPQIYFLDYNGEIKSDLNQEILNLAISNNIKVMPLLANITGKYFDRKKVHNLLDDKKNWEKVAIFLREEAKKNNYIGWQLDLENIDVKYKDTYTEFAKFLKEEFNKDNLLLSIAVVSQISNNPKDYLIYEKKQPNYYKYWAGVYDYKKLGEIVDFLSIMIYDEPNSPGPVATLDWSKKVIEYAKSQVPEEKLSLGIPSYGWAYRKGQNKMFTMVDYNFTNSKLIDFDKSDIKNMTVSAGISKKYGNISWVSYNKYGKKYTIWYEDKLSFQTKLEQIKKLTPKARGISVWVLGDEDKKIWELF